MGLKNCNFKHTGSGNLAIRLARHLERGLRTKQEAVVAAAEYYRVSPQEVHDGFYESENDRRKTPTGLRHTKGEL